MHNTVFDKLIWCTIGPKSFLFRTAPFSGPNGTVNYGYIVTNSINSLLIALRSIPNGAHTKPLLSQFWPMLQNISETLTHKYMK